MSTILTNNNIAAGTNNVHGWTNGTTWVNPSSITTSNTWTTQEFQPTLEIKDNAITYTYGMSENFYQHELLVTQIFRDQNQNIVKSKVICQYWVGSPSKEKIEYKRLGKKSPVELVIRTLRTIQL